MLSFAALKLLALFAAPGSLAEAPAPAEPLTVTDSSPAISGLQVFPPLPYAGEPLLSATATGKPPLSWTWRIPGLPAATTNPAMVDTSRALRLGSTRPA